MPKVYFDVCCLNRPFDDQTQDRVRLESEAVISILTRVSRGELLHISSTIAQVEVHNNSNRELRARLQKIAGDASEFIEIEEKQILRADELQRLGFHYFDALHLACAETAGSDVFLTTDDQLLRLAFRVKEQIKVRVINPMSWLMEDITNDERNDD